MDSLLGPGRRGPPFLLFLLALWAPLSLAEAENQESRDCFFPCPEHAVCVNTSCRCQPGFQSVSRQMELTPDDYCDDINECSSQPDICGENAKCENTEGSFFCLCSPGFQLKSGGMKFQNKSQNTCEDVEECLKNPGICKKRKVCVNTQGSYECKCQPGFESDPKNPEVCKDVDECKSKVHSCHKSTHCLNKVGTFECRCRRGWKPVSGSPEGPNTTVCEDVDECGSGKHQCHSSTTCNNTLGSYFCTCPPGWTPKPGFQNKLNTTVCEEGTFPAWAPPQLDIKSQNLSSFFDKVQDLSRNFKASEAQGTIKKLIDALDKLLNEPGDLNNLSPRERHRVATSLLLGLESVLRHLAKMVPGDSFTYLSNSTSELSLRIQDPGSDNVTLGQSHARMQLNWTVASAAGDSERTVAGMFSSYGMVKLVSKANLTLDPKKLEELKEIHEGPVRGIRKVDVLSAVNSVFLSNHDTQELALPVFFAFSHKNQLPGTRQERLCAFWNNHSTEGGRWDTEGCETLGSDGSSTTCRCHHLSSFAILMAHYDVQDPQLALITKVGLGLSLVSLFLCVLTFLLVRPIQGSRTTVHLHLCICLLLGSLLFLAGVENQGGEVGWRCRLVAMLLHYCFLAAFCWMSLEGLELYFLVVRVFRGQGLPKAWLLLLGYGVPLLIVGITASVGRGRDFGQDEDLGHGHGYSFGHGYGRVSCCWLKLEGGFLWSFLGPVIAIILCNAFIFVVTVWKLAQKFSEINPDMNKLKKARALTITAVAQLVVLGCTWGFGLFLFEPRSWANRLMSYMFTLLNCLQGLFLFVLHCLLNKKVREEYHKWACRLAGTKYSEFATSTTGSSQNQTQSRVLRPSESGM